MNLLPSMPLRHQSVCFVSETGQTERPLRDPSVRYRCYHPAEMLSSAGHRCVIQAAAKFHEDPCLDYDIYVFHRPNMARPNFARTIANLRRFGARLIADYDDLIFGPEEIALISSAVKNKTMTPERAVAAFSSNLAGLHAFEMVTTSTEPLAAMAQKFNPRARVAVVPNIVPDSVLKLQRYLGTPHRRRPPGVIGYFAGTKSHDRDFPIVEAILHRVLSENSDLHFLVVGPVTVPRAIASLPNVSTAPVVNYLRLPSLMAMCTTVIAPLESSAFNDCKSRVKFLEAAVAGCRLIATPIPDMQAIGADHLTLAATADDWYEAFHTVYAAGAHHDLAARNFAFLSQMRHLDGLKELGGATMRILFYIEPHPLRESQSTLNNIIRKLLPLLSLERSNFDVRMFANDATFKKVGDLLNKCESRLIRTTPDEEQTIQSLMPPWDPEGISIWLELMEGTGSVSEKYIGMLRRIWRQFPFDVIVHWGENGAVSRFITEYPIVRIAMELGCTRPPFMDSIVMDPFGTNGSGVVSKLSIADLREIVGSSPMSRHEALLAYSQNLEALAYEQQFQPLPPDLAGRLAQAERVAFFPLQLFDDANLLRFSPFKTLSEAVVHAVPRLVEAGYLVLIKPHPASQQRSGSHMANAVAKRQLRPWGHQVLWCDQPNVAYDNARLMAVSDIVVTVNSSVGFEALYFDKPVVVLGEALYKPRDLFPTLDQIVEGSFDEVAYREGIGYLRRFFLGGYLQPERICSDASSFQRHVGLMVRLWRQYGDDPVAIAKGLWQVSSPSIQAYAEGAVFSGLSVPGQAEFGVPAVPASKLSATSDAALRFWLSPAHRLFVHSGCDKLSDFDVWLDERLSDPKKGLAEVVKVGDFLDPGRYLDLHEDVRSRGVNPLSHFIQNGFLEGRPLRAELPRLKPKDVAALLKRAAVVIHEKVLQPLRPLTAEEMVRRQSSHGQVRAALADRTPKIAVVAHLYYQNLVPEILERLNAIPEAFDLIVTLPDWGGRGIRDLVRAAYPDAVFYPSADRGRDIGPFIDLLPVLIEKGYDALLKIQTKRDYYQSGRQLWEFADLWRNQSFDALLGSTERARDILAAFRENAALAMVGPAPHFVSLSEYPYHDEGILAAQLLGAEEGRGFFSGKMFWVRPDCLRPFVGEGRLSINSFAPDSWADEETVSALVERMLGHAATIAGFTIAGAPVDPHAALELDLHPASQGMHDYLATAVQAKGEIKMDRKQGALAW